MTATHEHAFALGPRDEDLARCVHCGLCLQYCPTYVVTGLETESPRGRLALMRAAVEGKLNMSDGFAEHMDLCLQCRACEDVCPSGVPYGRLMEATRAQMYDHRERPAVRRFVA